MRSICWPAIILALFAVTGCGGKPQEQADSGRGAVGAVVPRPQTAMGTTAEAKYAEDARAALNAVQDVQSLVRSGITYSEYTRRIGDARIAVDRFMRLQSRDLAPPSREKIDLAIGCYELAAGDWAKSFDTEWGHESADLHKQMMQELWRTADRHIVAAEAALNSLAATASHR